MKKTLIVNGILVIALISVLIGCTKEEPVEELDPKSEEVMALLESVKIDDFDNLDLTGYFYLNGDIDQDSMENDYKLALGLKMAIEDNDDYEDITLTKQEMASNIRSILGEEVTYTDESFGYSLIYNAEYDLKNETYTHELVPHGAIMPPFYISKIINATKSGEYIIIDEKAAYAVHEGDVYDDTPPLDIYTPDQKILIASKVAYDTFDADAFIDEHADELATYRYTFRQGDVDYYFESMTIIDQ